MRSFPSQGGADLVTVVLPTKNEEVAIGPTLRSLPRETLSAMGFEMQVVVIDGESDDATRDVVYEHGGAAVVFDREGGKGSALINARDRFEGDYVVMLDADGTYAVDAIPRLLEPLVQDEADIVMGARDPQPGSTPVHHLFGNKVLSILASFLYSRSCPDLCTGMWAFRREALQALPLRSEGFEIEAEMFAYATRLGLRIQHVRVDYLPRLGASKLDALDAFDITFWLMRSRVAPLDPDQDAGTHA